MKKTHKITLIILTFLVVLSCNKESLVDGYNNTPEGFKDDGVVYAKVNGKSFKSIKAETQAYRRSSSKGTITTISGFNQADQHISLDILNFSGMKKYRLDEQYSTGICDTWFIERDNNNARLYTAPYANGGLSGEVDITSYENGMISGKFHFKAKELNSGYYIENYKTITEGSFKNIPLR